MALKRKITNDVASTTKKAKLYVSRDAMRDETRETTYSSSASVEPSDDEPYQSQEYSPEWELVGEDSRDALKVGVEAPERIVLAFRNTKSSEETSYTYTRTADDIDWNDKKDIDKINKWRRQLFSRKDFTSRHRKTIWAPAEEAFVELMMGELAASKEQLLPHPKKLLDAFNDFFEGRSDLIDANGKLLPMRKSRKLATFSTYLRRQGSIRVTLHNIIKNRMLDNTDEARVPTITDAMIAAYMKTTPRGDLSQLRAPATSGEGNVASRQTDSESRTKEITNIGLQTSSTSYTDGPITTTSESAVLDLQEHSVSTLPPTAASSAYCSSR
jgi:hypothetical protein